MCGDYGVLYQLWNDSEAAGSALQRACGEAGIERLVIPAVTGELRQVRFPDDGSSRFFQSEGGWHYQPESGRFENTRVKPRVARWCGARDVLGRLSERAATLSLRLSFRVELRGVPHLLEHCPNTRCRNAWGDEDRPAGMCVSNPDVRELLRATLDELTRYDPAGYEIADWAVDSPLDRREPRPMDWNPAARRLLDMCFCESCRQIAMSSGSDPDHAARAVRVRFERRAVSNGATTAEDVIGADPVVETYCRVRAANNAAWMERLAGAHTEYVKMRLCHADESRTAVALAGWQVLCRWPSSTASAESAPGPAVDPIEAALRHLINEHGPQAGLSLPIWRPTFADAAGLVRVVTSAAAAGIRYFDFEGLHESPPEALTWLKQAVRFARRG